MKKYILIIASLFFIAMTSFTEVDASSNKDILDGEKTCIYDRQKNDIELIFNNANSSSIATPELQNSLPSPSFRIISSQKKTQQNILNNLLLKRFTSEAQPTNHYNTKSSFPLSSKEDLIVIVRHLII